MEFNILFGGEAGQGPNILTHILGEALVKQGYYVFYSRDYQSLIRGGHNFNVLSFSDESIQSNKSKFDIIVALDKYTEEIHKNNLKSSGIILKGDHPNMYFAGVLFKILGIEFEVLENELKNLEKRFKENIEESKQGYNATDGKKEIFSAKTNQEKQFINGSQGIAEGAIKSGMNIYYAYPMTPATPVLTELAQKENSHKTIQLENEIAVVNAGIGSSITGKKVMVGTSGGGFDLMTEGLSLCGIAGIPLVFYLSQRPGPATGVATYTSQGDLNIARYSGHGEFNRIVLAPGDPNECQELISQAFYLSQKFSIPVIVISDKHLGESFYSLDKNPEITSSKILTKLQRFNSYEKDSMGSATEDSEIIKKNIQQRLKVGEEIQKESEKFEQYKIYGKKDSKNIILFWGSTKGAILDAIKDLNCKAIQMLYIEPFSNKIKKEIENKNLILIENNSTAQLGNLIKEKTGIEISKENKILRFDGRPFLNDELKQEIERILK